MGHPRNHHTPPQKTDKVAKMNPEMPEKTFGNETKYCRSMVI